MQHNQYLKLISIQDNNQPLKIIADQFQIEKYIKETNTEIGIIYQDKYLTFVKDLVEFPNGYRGTYSRLISTADLNGGQGSVVFPVIQNKIVLIHIFRHATQSWQWEVPRGFGEPNTNPIDNAKKEISEEINGTIKKIFDLGDYHSNTGLEMTKVKLYFAELSSTGQTNYLEGIEKIKLVSIKEFEEMLKTNQILDGFTIAAYAKAKLFGYI